MTLAEMYRTHAAECVALAQKSRNPEDRARLLQMAQSWLQLAERHEPKSGDPKSDVSKSHEPKGDVPKSDAQA